MDLNAIKNRLSQLQTTNTRTSNLWKPQPGLQLVRIVPYKFNKDNPFIELYFHYGLGDKNYLSPISFGRPDPIEEFAQKLKSTGSKDDYRLGKKVEAKMRTFAPPSTSIRVKPNQTPITEDASMLESLKESQKNITEIYQEKSYEELTQALNEYLNGDSTSEEIKKEEKPTPVAAASTYNSQKTSDAFDDLFNN